MKFILSLLFVYSSLTPLFAAGVIQLHVQQDELKIDRQFSVDIIVDKAPNVYGVQLEVKYDPEMFTPVDADSKKKGIQITPGDFFQKKNLFTLKNKVNAEKGLINYIVSQTNPTEEVNGEGIIARLIFKSTGKQGLANISLKSSKFGTRSGKVVTLSTGSPLTFVIKDNVIIPPINEAMKTNLASTNKLVISNVGILIGALFLIAVTTVIVKKGNTSTDTV